MVLRKAVVADIPAIIDVNLRTIPEHYKKEFWEQCIAEHLSHVCLLDDKMIGYCIAITQNYLSIEKCGIIISIAVLPETRNKGVATSLLHKTWDLMKQKNIYSCALQVRVTNWTAIKLYEKLNMRQVGIHPKYYPDLESAYIYLKKL